MLSFPDYFAETRFEVLDLTPDSKVLSSIYFVALADLMSMILVLSFFLIDYIVRGKE